MGKVKINDPMLTSVNDLFRLKQNGAAALTEISLDLIDPFPNHPFHVVQDEALEQLAKSIAENGVYNKVLLRPKGERYELISGHRRVAASKLAGKDTIPAVVEEMDDARATVMMVDSNLRQRQELLPSEKAFAYKMKLEAIRRQGGRPSNENGGQLDHHLSGRKSRDVVAEEAGESAKQISRYIRLTELIPELLSLVDAGHLPLNPAVELSYLNEKEQSLVRDIMQRDEMGPSLEQAKRLREASEQDELNHTVLSMVFMENKPSKGNISLKSSAVRSYYPSTATTKEIEESLIGLASAYARIKEYFPPNTAQDEISKDIIRIIEQKYGRNSRY